MSDTTLYKSGEYVVDTGERAYTHGKKFDALIVWFPSDDIPPFTMEIPSNMSMKQRTDMGRALAEHLLAVYQRGCHAGAWDVQDKIKTALGVD